MFEVSAVPSVMEQGERLIRNACAERSPPGRAEALMREYRLSHPDVQYAIVIGLIARVSMRSAPAAQEAASA